MMGVHGNGLTSLVWMKPTPRSTVIEFFFPQGFAHDEYTTRGLQSFLERQLPSLDMLKDFMAVSKPRLGESANSAEDTTRETKS